MIKTRSILAFGLVAIALICSTGIAAAASGNETDSLAAPTIDTLTPFRGSIGPDHSLYGLKIAFENLDESFTVNESERLEKQVAHADSRLAELKFELAENKTDAADRVLELYRLKLNQTETALAQYVPNGTGTPSGPDNPGLGHAREMILKHQSVLENLLSAHPGNPGLVRAYNNSLALEQKFENRLEQRMEARYGQTFGWENATQTRLEQHDSLQTRTLAQDNLRRHDFGPAGNSTRPDPGINQTVDSVNPGNNRNQGSLQATNQTADNKQTPTSDKSAQNGQGNTHNNAGNSQNSNINGDSAGRNSDSGSGNRVNPEKSQNGNANGNNGGTNPGTTRDAANSGGQGGNSDQKMKNR